MKTRTSGSRIGIWGAWHLLAALAIAFGVSHLRLAPLWHLDPGPRLFFVGLGASYLVCALASTPLLAIGSRRRWRSAGLVGTVVLSGFLLFLVVLDLDFPRSALLVGLSAAFVLLLIPAFLSPLVRAIGVGALACGLGVVLAMGALETPRAEETAVLPPGAEVVSSTHYQLLVTSHPDVFGIPQASGGGLAAFGDRVVLVTSEGDLHLFEVPEAGAPIEPEPGVPSVPFNRDEFVADHSGRTDVRLDWFRVAGIVLRGGTPVDTLFVSHHHWNRDESCVTLRVSTATLPVSAFEDGDALDWGVLFESTPCLPLKGLGHRFAGHQVGGRMVFDESSLLLSVGDFEWDGSNSEVAWSQDPEASYGKVLRIDPETGASSIFTLGHRNPQGLAVAGDGTIWETEHGPQGGDELNRLVAGANYGWPLVTYGVDYGTTSWPFNRDQGRHTGFERPVFAWLPSIGVSSVLESRGELFEAWEGDLLVGALNDQALWRVRPTGAGVRFAERIPVVDAEIRDLIQLPDGRLVLLTERVFEGRGRSAVAFVEPAPTGPVEELPELASAVRGELLFEGRCGACHSIDDGVGVTIGPSLRGIVGRAVASDPGFGYSAALQGLGGVWSRDRLDSFLADPSRFVPGTSMQSDGIPQAGDRSAVIDFLLDAG